MNTQVLVKRIEKLEKQIKTLQLGQKPRAFLAGGKITDALFNQFKKAWFESGYAKSPKQTLKYPDLTWSDFQEAKKIWSKPPKFITKKDFARWK